METALKKLVHQSFKYVILSLALMTTSCGGDDDDDNNDDMVPDPTDEPTDLSIEPITDLFVGDIANNGNATDLQVYYTRSSTSQLIKENRIMLVKSGSFDLDAANAVEESNYSGVLANSVDNVLDINSKDVDGDDIVEGVEYAVHILSVSDDASVPNVLSDPFEIRLEQKSTVRNLTDYIRAGSGGMDSDAAGNIYMADFGATLSGPPGARVYIITPEGEVSTFAEGLVGASGNEFDSQGNLFQSNIGGNSVSKITPDGVVTTFVSNTLQGPVGITFDPADNMFVANCSKNDISMVTPEGTASTFARGGLFNCPNGITIDPDGNLYVANFGNGGIIKITADGTASQLTTISGNNNGHLLYHDGLLWVVGRSANRIYTVTLEGEVTIFAGAGPRGNRNGALDQARFSLPNDLAFSPDGKFIYINDVDPDLAAGELSPSIIRVIEIVE